MFCTSGLMNSLHGSVVCTFIFLCEVYHLSSRCCWLSPYMFECLLHVWMLSVYVCCLSAFSLLLCWVDFRQGGGHLVYHKVDKDIAYQLNTPLTFKLFRESILSVYYCCCSCLFWNSLSFSLSHPCARVHVQTDEILFFCFFLVERTDEIMHSQFRGFTALPLC